MGVHWNTKNKGQEKTQHKTTSVSSFRDPIWFNVASDFDGTTTTMTHTKLEQKLDFVDRCWFITHSFRDFDDTFCMPLLAILKS